MSMMEPQALRDAKTAIRESTNEFCKGFFAAFKLHTVHGLSKQREQMEKEKIKITSKQSKKVPRRNRSSATASFSSQPDPKIVATITDWKEVKHVQHFGVYAIEVVCEDGRPRQTVYRRYRDFEGLHKKFGKLTIGVKLPSTSSGSEGIGDAGVKRRSSVERFLKKNPNKWDQSFHLQRAKQLQPLLDLLCNLPDAWKQPRLLEFLNITPIEDKAFDLVTGIFESILEEYTQNWGASREVIHAHSPGHIFCFALFSKIRGYVTILKDPNQTSKPLKVLAKQQLNAAIDRTEKHIDELLLKARAVYLRLYRLLDASVEVATLGKILALAQQKALGAQFDSHFQSISSQLEVIAGSVMKHLFKPLAHCWWELQPYRIRALTSLEDALDTGDGSKAIQFEGLMNDLRERAGTVVQETLTQPSNDHLAEISRSVQRPLDKISESFRVISSLVKPIVEFILTSRGCTDIISEVISTRTKLMQVDLSLNGLRVEALLSELEAFTLSRLPQVKNTYARTARELHWRVTKASAGNRWFNNGFAKICMKIAKTYPRMLRTLVFKFADYASVLAKAVPQSQWPTAVLDSLALAYWKARGVIRKTLLASLKSLVMLIIQPALDQSIDAIKGKLEFSVGIFDMPEMFSEFLDSMDILGLACKVLIDSATADILETQFFHPFSEGWEKAFPEFSQLAAAGQGRPSYYERAMDLEKKSAALWEIQHPTGLAPPPAIVLAANPNPGLPTSNSAPALLSQSQPIPVTSGAMNTQYTMQRGASFQNLAPSYVSPPNSYSASAAPAGPFTATSPASPPPAGSGAAIETGGGLTPSGRPQSTFLRGLTNMKQPEPVAPAAAPAQAPAAAVATSQPYTYQPMAPQPVLSQPTQAPPHSDPAQGYLDPFTFFSPPKPNGAPNLTQTFTPIDWSVPTPAMGGAPLPNYADHRISMSAVMLDSMNGPNNFVMFDDVFAAINPNPAQPKVGGGPVPTGQTPPQYKNVFQ